MALWKDTVNQKEPTPISQGAGAKEPDKPGAYNPPQEVPRRAAARSDAKESLIAADLAIEGKIEGSGHVRIAGRFNGDVSVDGNLTIEQGAKVTGGVRAHTVTVGGELEGNIEAASSVELLATGVLTGDVAAASLTVAAGSRMRGRVEFGWEGKGTHKIAAKKESGAAS